ARPTKPQPVATVAVTPTEVTLAEGGSTKLTAVLKIAGGADRAPGRVTWTSSNPGVATISSGGTLTAIHPGTAVVTARVTPSSSGDARITVLPRGPAVVTVTLSAVPPRVSVGDTFSLVATARDNAGKPVGGQSVQWHSSNESVATVSPEGLVAAVGAGATQL